MKFIKLFEDFDFEDALNAMEGFRVNLQPDNTKDCCWDKLKL